MTTNCPEPVNLEASALAAASMMRGLADSRRLILLCKLHELGTADVRELARVTGVPALTVGRQMATMECEGLLRGEGSGQMRRYCIGDPRLRRLLQTVHAVFCPREVANHFAPIAARTRESGGLWL